jgi:hypothetical protein
MSQPRDKANIQRLLNGLEGPTVRELCIDALRDWHRRVPQETVVSMHGVLGWELVPRLLERANETASFEERNQLKEPFIDAQHETWMFGVSEFIWWFIRAGFAVPLTFVNHNLIDMRLTRQGLGFLGQTEDHPLLPGFVGRVRDRCRGIPDETIALLLDANDCLASSLRRPAVVMLGVAYEAAVEAVVASLVNHQILQPPALDLGAARRIAAVRGVIDNVMPDATPQERDDRFATHRAYNFADDLRQRRNHASHTDPRYGFIDRQEVEELLVGAGRNLPPLWWMFRR